MKKIEKKLVTYIADAVLLSAIDVPMRISSKMQKPTGVYINNSVFIWLLSRTNRMLGYF